MRLKNKQFFALKASLPYLKFGVRPFLSRSRFLEYCEAFLEEEELDFLKGLSLAVPEKLPEGDSCEAEYAGYETALRNAVALVRAKKKGIRGDLFLRENTGKAADEDMSSLITVLQNAPDPLEREKILDKARWTRLEELENAHYADLDALSIYCRKLLILEKWTQYQPDAAEKNLDNTVMALEKAAEDRSV
ncbi:MAG: DUF2764 family protein [Lentisphaeria bacterium]|nr:DUF2764 family protein [Lentisphaeria bacterium]